MSKVAWEPGTAFAGGIFCSVWHLRQYPDDNANAPLCRTRVKLTGDNLRCDDLLNNDTIPERRRCSKCVRALAAGQWAEETPEKSKKRERARREWEKVEKELVAKYGKGAGE